MGYKPLPKCEHRGDECTCHSPMIGDFKILGIKLGQRRCILLDPSSRGVCQWLKPLTPAQLTPPTKNIPVLNVADTQTVEQLSAVYTYSCKHRGVNGDCKKINLIATYGSQKCIYTVDRFNLGECGYHDNFKPHDATNVLNTNPIDMSTPVVVPKGVYNCHLNPCHLKRISEDSYECDHCGCQITNAKKKLRGGFSC